MKAPRALIIVAVAAFGFAPPASAQRSTSTRGGSASRPSDARASGQTPSDARAGHETAQTGDATRRGQPSEAGRRAGARRPVAFLPFGWWPYLDFDAVDDVTQGEVVESTAAAPPQVQPPTQPSLIQPVQTTALPEPAARAARGKLQIEVTPASAQVIVDGFYVGTVDEVARLGSGLDVTAGWHRLEFRAQGYATPAVNITVEANRTFTYRGDLKPLSR